MRWKKGKREKDIKRGSNHVFKEKTNDFLKFRTFSLSGQRVERTIYEYQILLTIKIKLTTKKSPPPPPQIFEENPPKYQIKIKDPDLC